MAFGVGARLVVPTTRRRQLARAGVARTDRAWLYGPECLDGGLRGQSVRSFSWLTEKMSGFGLIRPSVPVRNWHETPACYTRSSVPRYECAELVTV